MILVPLGPAQRNGGRKGAEEEEEEGRNRTTPLKNTLQRTASTPSINNIN